MRSRHSLLPSLSAARGVPLSAAIAVMCLTSSAGCSTATTSLDVGSGAYDAAPIDATADAASIERDAATADDAAVTIDAARGDASLPDAGPTSYATSFDGTESPIVEDGGWRLGEREGIDWQDVFMAGGLAFGAGPSPDSYDDCVAVRADPPSARHTVRATIHVDAGFSPSYNQELEVIVGGTIEPHSIHLYEVLWSVAGNFQVVRWDGALGVFDTSLPLSGPGPGVPADGDVLEVSYDASDASDVHIVVRKNGVQVAEVHDTTSLRITNGTPGLSFFSRAPDASEMSRYCFSDWSYTVP